MKTTSSKIFNSIILLVLLFTSCNPRYQKEEGKWAYVSYNEAVGKHVVELNADENSFEILENRDYAKDAYLVYHAGSIIEEADPKTFSVINNKGYSKDKNHVFFYGIAVIFADPETFEFLKSPYSRDGQHIFCGTIPMEVKNTHEFKVTKSTGARTGHLTSSFIEKNREYAWLDTLDYEIVYYGEGKGKTKTERFEGFKKVE